MDRQKIECMVNEFFDDYEAARSNLFKRFLIFLGSSAVCLIAGFILLEIVYSQPFLEGTGCVLVIAGVVLAVISKKTFVKYRVARKEAEGQMEAQILSEIIAEELGGEYEASSDYTKLKKRTASLGEDRKRITKTFTGNCNGKNYKITQEYRERVTDIKTIDIGDNISINRKLVIDPVYSDTLYDFDARHYVDGTILIESHHFGSGYGSDILFSAGKEPIRRIKMDNKSFPYTVRANDELTAYKYLTPGMMSDITEFFGKYDGKTMTVENDTVNAVLTKRVADINLPISFFQSLRNTEKNTIRIIFTASRCLPSRRSERFFPSPTEYPEPA